MNSSSSRRRRSPLAPEVSDDLRDVDLFRRWFRELLKAPVPAGVGEWQRRFELEDMRAALAELQQEAIDEHWGQHDAAQVGGAR